MLLTLTKHFLSILENVARSAKEKVNKLVQTIARPRFHCCGGLHNDQPSYTSSERTSVTL